MSQFDLESQYNQTLQNTVGKSQQERDKELIRNRTTDPNTDWASRGVSGHRFAGFQELSNVPTLDEETKQTLSPIIGNYTEGGKDLAGYYGKYNPYEQSQAQEWLGSQGLKPTQAAWDNDLERVFGKVPKAYGSAYLGKDANDVTTQPGLEAEFQKYGLQNVSSKFNPELAGLVPDYTKDLFNFKNQQYKKGDLDTYSWQDGPSLEQTVSDLYNQYFTSRTGKYIDTPMWSQNANGFGYVRNQAPDYEAPLFHMSSDNDPQEHQSMYFGGDQPEDFNARYQYYNSYDKSDKTRYNTQEEANQAYRSKLDRDLFGKVDTDAERWELLSQLRSGKDLSNTHSYTADPNSPYRASQNLAAEYTIGNNISDAISGQDALLGARRLMDSKGNIVGYSGAMPTVEQNQWDLDEKYKSGSGWMRSGREFRDVGNQAVGAQFNNPDWWQQNAKNNNGNWYLDAINAANNPGYTNIDAYNRQTADWERKPSGASQYAPAIAKAVMSFMNPAFGAFVNTMSSGLNGGNWGKAIGQGALSYAGSELGNLYGGDVGGALNLSGDMAKSVGSSLIGGGVGLAGNAILGNKTDWRSALANVLGSAAGGAVGDFAGNSLGDLTNVATGAVKGLTSGTVSHLFSPKNTSGDDIAMRTATGAISGLGNLFAPADASRSEKKSYNDTAKTLSELGNTAYKLSKQRKQ